MILKRIAAFVTIAAMLLVAAPVAHRSTSRLEAATPSDAGSCAGNGIPMFALLNVSPDLLQANRVKAVIPAPATPAPSPTPSKLYYGYAINNLDQCQGYTLQMDGSGNHCALYDPSKNIVFDFTDGLPVYVVHSSSQTWSLVQPDCSYNRGT